MSKQHVNEINFLCSTFVTSVSYRYGYSHFITEGQPWGEVKSEGGDITVTAGRKGSSECADWFKAYVDRNYNHMIHTGGGDNLPDKLNFAFTGKLTIDNQSFDVCIGQGHCSGEHNWHIASKDIVADSNAKNGTIGIGIRMLQDGSHSFKLSKIL